MSLEKYHQKKVKKQLKQNKLVYAFVFAIYNISVSQKNYFSNTFNDTILKLLHRANTGSKALKNIKFLRNKLISNIFCELLSFFFK